MVLVSTKMALLTELGAASACNDYDAGMDRRSVKDWEIGSRDQPALPRETCDPCQYSGLTRF